MAVERPFSAGAAFVSRDFQSGYLMPELRFVQDTFYIPVKSREAEGDVTRLQAISLNILVQTVNDLP
jgi:hypothetical protein